MYYTIGQRQGLGIGGTEEGSAEPWYVVAKAPDENRLIVAQGVDNSHLYHSHCRITDLHWIAQSVDNLPFACSAKSRYRQQDSGCQMTALEHSNASVEFDTPQRAITPGQALVLYAGEQCLGGGTIEVAYN